MKNEIVLFADGDINLEVELRPELETVWLTQKQMGEYHIKIIYLGFSSSRTFIGKTDRRLIQLT